MEKEMFEILAVQKEKDELVMLETYNQKTERFGLSLTQEEAKELIVSRNHSLKKY